MKLLLDENLPIKLKYRFIENGIDAFTVKDMNWLGKKNGELLKLMINVSFDCFITIDNNITFQQNFINYPIPVLVLISYNNTYPNIMKFFNDILGSLKNNWLGVKSITI